MRTLPYLNRLAPLTCLVMPAALLAVSCGSGTIDAAQQPTTAVPTTPAPTTQVPATLPPSLPGGPVRGSVVAGGGSSFGECGGFCVTEVTFDGNHVVLTLSTWDDTSDHVMSGTLSDETATLIADLGVGVAEAPLDEVYGCPDCADGGAEWISFANGDLRTTVTFEFGYPPTELADLSSLTRAVASDLVTCSTSERVSADDSCMEPPTLQTPNDQ